MSELEREREVERVIDELERKRDRLAEQGGVDGLTIMALCAERDWLLSVIDQKDDLLNEQVECIEQLETDIDRLREALSRHGHIFDPDLMCVCKVLDDGALGEETG